MSPRRSSRPVPDRVAELDLLERVPLVGGMDEVGRGALAGPVTVGLAVVGPSTPGDFPPGLADSKLLTARRREALVAPCRDWLTDWALGSATPAEIDTWGIVGALRLAGRRALAQVAAHGHLPGVVILDGSADWLSQPPDDLLTAVTASAPQSPPRNREDDSVREDDDVALAPGLVPPVHTQVRADARCAVVAAASVLAKVHRDGLMRDLEDPGYGWAGNKGYASRAHVEALSRLGASDQHRRSWRLPGLEDHAAQGMMTR